jgi:hypothetical protein
LLREAELAPRRGEREPVVANGQTAHDPS